MSDLISRSALMEHKTLIPGFIGEYVAVRAINEAPAVEAVPVVRCRECKHWEDGYLGYCTKIHTAMEYNDFCSYGERKADE